MEVRHVPGVKPLQPDPDHRPDPDPQEQSIIDKRALPTGLRSDAIRHFWSQELKRQAMFSARTTSREYLEKVKAALAEFQAGVGESSAGGPMSQGLERARTQMAETLQDLGLLEREGDGSVAQRMTSLGSTMRLTLIVKTNTALAHSWQQKAASQDPLQKILRPYFELYRAEGRKEPRDWGRRWEECAAAVGWQGVVKGTPRMIATTDSPVWAELGNRFGDSIGVETPPFCWGSGMRWRTVTAKEVRDAGLEVG